MNGSRTMEPAAYLDSLRPAGSKRSSKRDLIVNVFLRQEGHLTADDLVELIRREESSRSDPSMPTPGMSRATVYRTLQWMVEAGMNSFSRVTWSERRKTSATLSGSSRAPWIAGAI